MNIHRHINFFRYAEQAQALLVKSGIRFKSSGFPDLTKFEYVKALPDSIEVWPYNKRNQARNPRNTILAFYEADTCLYGYLNSIDKVASNLSIYYGVTGFDLSPCLDFSIEEQNAALLLNALTNGLFLMQGIRVIPSLRIGNSETANALESYPRNICYSFGALGCGQKYRFIGQQILAFKLTLCKPSQVLSYGKLIDADKQIFDLWNIPVVNVPDYQTRTRERARERKRHHV